MKYCKKQKDQKQIENQSFYNKPWILKTNISRTNEFTLTIITRTNRFTGINITLADWFTWANFKWWTGFLGKTVVSQADLLKQMLL